MAGYQTSGFAFQGAGQFAFQGGVAASPLGPSRYRGGKGSTVKRSVIARAKARIQNADSKN